MEERAPVWVSEFITKAATVQKDLAEFVAGLKRNFCYLVVVTNIPPPLFKLKIC
jgi:hypothetical protein